MNTIAAGSGLKIWLFLAAVLGPFVYFVALKYQGINIEYNGSFYYGLITLILVKFLPQAKISLCLMGSNKIFDCLFILSFACNVLLWNLWSVSGVGIVIALFAKMFYSFILYEFLQKKIRKWYLLLILVFLVLSPWRSPVFYVSIIFVLRVYLKGNMKVSLKNVVKAILGMFFLYFIFKNSTVRKLDLESNIGIEEVGLQLGYRANSLHENSLVFNYLRQGGDLLHGKTIRSAFYELIPSYFLAPNRGNNYYFLHEYPKKLGLLNLADDSTSWGINFISELFANFGFSLGGLVQIVFWGIIFLRIPSFPNRLFVGKWRVLWNSIVFFSYLQLVTLSYYLSEVFWTCILLLIFQYLEYTILQRRVRKV
jgi:hypothetical protein